MDRGPMALFGAIVAVGLGPAMWLGAQFGNAGSTPAKPPAVSSELKPGTVRTGDNGGAAGAATDDSSVVLETRPRAGNKPLRPGSSASSSQSNSADPDPSADPSGTPTPSDKPSTPPTESTTDPTDPPTDPEPPSPPATQAAGDPYGATSVTLPI